jgi:hypothetical protein
MIPAVNGLLVFHADRSDSNFVQTSRQSYNCSRLAQGFQCGRPVPDRPLFQPDDMIPVAWAQSFAGHSRSMDTFGVYAHAMDGQGDQITAGVEEIFKDILREMEKAAK